MAAGHQGLGQNEKEVMRDLNLMGGPTKDNRDALIAILEEQLKNTNVANVSLRNKIQSRIDFLNTGIIGGDNKKKIDWNIMDNTGEVKIEKIDKRHAGGSITKGRTYALEPGEIPFKAPFTGTVATSGKVRQLLASRGGRTTIINMPPEIIEGKMPEIKGDSPIATHVNLIDSMNALNPYMTETPSVLGISV